MSVADIRPRSLDGERALHAGRAVAGDRAEELVLARLEVALIFETPPLETTSPFSLTPLPSTAMLWSTEDSFGESISS